ncbi:MAG: hypothetical protein N2746_04685 [Deltaproteobacteria bacterium]|nr:hypothetical protein [Deltaproteobacteria bacterium]
MPERTLFFILPPNYYTLIPIRLKKRRVMAIKAGPIISPANNITAINKKTEYFSKNSMIYILFSGKIPYKILLPSRGGIGMRLKRNNPIFTCITLIINRKRALKTYESLLGIITSNILPKSIISVAKMRLLRGPANAVYIIPFLIDIFRLKNKGLKGTGFAHPKNGIPEKTIPIIGMITVPRRSIWANGFNVSLPSLYAVSSPSLYDTSACEYS